MMQFIRAASRHFLAPAARPAPRLSRHSRSCLQRYSGPRIATRRSYASAADTVKKAGGDLPWLLAAAAVTVPGVYYALQPSANAHGDDDGHDSHGASHGDGEESGEAQENPAPAEQSEKSGKSENSEKDVQQSGKDSESGDDGDSDEGSSTDSKSGKVDGVNFAGGTKKLESDAKGATKKRIDSDLAKNIGEGVSSGTEDDMSNKQRGLTNTDTRHSIDITNDPGKSKKGEGTAETAKIKGTVRGDRPQV